MPFFIVKYNLLVLGKLYLVSADGWR